MINSSYYSYQTRQHPRRRLFQPRHHVHPEKQPPLDRETPQIRPPTHPLQAIRLYTALAQSYRQNGDAPKALECYNQILQYDSLHTPTINRIGTLYCSQGFYERAIAFHKRALNIRPDDATAYKYIGKAYNDWGKPDKAIQSFIRATNLCNTDPETYMYLAELYGKQKKGERKQQSAYRRAARLGDKNAQAWLVKKGLTW